MIIVASPPLWAVLTQAFGAPLLVGVAGTLWGGSAAAGRRIARLAAFSASLGLFRYGTLAVAVIGVSGAQIDATWTVGADIGDRLINNTIFYLWLLPLVTAALGWAAAAATARIRPRLAVSVAAAPFTLPGQAGEGTPGQAGEGNPGHAGEGNPGHAGEGNPGPEWALPPAAGPADRGRSWRRTVYRLLLGAVVAVAVFGVALGLLA